MMRSELSDYLGRANDLRRWLLARVEALAQQLEGLRFQEFARRQVIIESDRSVSLAGFLMLRDGTLRADAPPHCVVVQSLTFTWGDSAAGTDSIPLTVTYDWDVRDAMDFACLEPNPISVTRVPQAVLDTALSYQFAQGSWGFAELLIPGPHLSNLSQAWRHAQPPHWDQIESFAAVGQVLEQQVGAPGVSRVSRDQVTAHFKELLDGPRYEAILQQLLLQFGEHVRDFGFSLRPSIDILPGGVFVDMTGRGWVYSSLETHLMEGSDNLRLVRVSWAGCWDADRQQMNLSVKVLVLAKPHQAEHEFDLALPPLILTAQSLQNHLRTKEWLAEFDNASVIGKQDIIALAHDTYEAMLP